MQFTYVFVIKLFQVKLGILYDFETWETEKKCAGLMIDVRGISVWFFTAKILLQMLFLF